MGKRSDGIVELERYGISGSQVYLLDVIPLIEMMWADGIVQAEEWKLLLEFVSEHVANINAAAGLTVLTPKEAAEFVNRFSGERPDPTLLQHLRELIPSVRLSNSDPVTNQQRREAILQWCLDIGAACVANYPYGSHERFDAKEKECFKSILNTLAVPAN